MKNTQPNFMQRHPVMKDVMSILIFVICVVVGTLLLNAYVFRSYNVVGPSMENTFIEDDRVIVNRFAETWAHFMGQEYVPERGQIIIFAGGSATGPLTCDPPSGIKNQYIIKRVIAFPGERVTVKDGVLTVYNDEHPDGYQPDEEWRGETATDASGNIETVEGPKLYTSGEVDTTVPDGELFVAGDNRVGSNSSDSRSGLGTIPYCRVVGPVLMRVYPFDKIRFF